MKDFNFDKLKNVEIPDSWISGALKVPKKPPFGIIFFRKVLPIVASLVLVLVLSFFVFYITNDNILNAQKPTQATPVSDTNTQNNDETNDLSTSVDNDETTYSDEKESQSQGTETTKKPTQSGSETAKPTQNPTGQNSSSNPSNKPNDDSSDPSGKPASSNPSNKPNGQPEPTEPSTPIVPSRFLECIATFDKSLLKGTDEVYFAIEPQPMGEWAENVEPTRYLVNSVRVVGNKVHASFNAMKSIDVTTSGNYFYYFYNKYGEVVYTNDVYIRVS